MAGYTAELRAELIALRWLHYGEIGGAVLVTRQLRNRELRRGLAQRCRGRQRKAQAHGDGEQRGVHKTLVTLPSMLTTGGSALSAIGDGRSGKTTA